MEQSENIEALAEALNCVQTEALFALTDKANPFFKSKYADLSSVWSVARKPLTTNGLSVVQTMDVCDSGNPVIVTTLLHVSGQWIRGRLEIPSPKKDPQGFGAAITYGRRYSLAAILGICPEDDDGERAMKSYRKPEKKKADTKPPATAPQMNKLMALSKKAWPSLSNTDSTLNGQALIAWFAGGDGQLTKWQASDLIGCFDEAILNYELESGKRFIDKSSEIVGPPPIGDEDIPY